MTLLPLQHPARPAGQAKGLDAHEDRRRNSGQRRDETGGKFRLATFDRVEGEPRVSMPERFDVPQSGNVHVRYCERFGKQFAFSAHSDSPAFVAGIEARNFEPANYTTSSSRPMVNEWSPWLVAQEYRP